MEREELVEAAQEVRLRRAATGLSQDELAETAHVGRSTVQKIERGESVRLKNLIKVMHALDDAERQLRGNRHREPITIDEFLARDPNLDDDTRAHFRNQYELLTGLTRYRRRSPADDETFSDVDGRRPGAIERIVRNAAVGKVPPPGDSPGSVPRKSEGPPSDSDGETASG